LKLLFTEFKKLLDKSEDKLLLDFDEKKCNATVDRAKVYVAQKKLVSFMYNTLWQTMSKMNHGALGSKLYMDKHANRAEFNQFVRYF